MMVTVTLTRAQAGMLHGLVIAEAHRLGYPVEYNDTHPEEWPNRLRKLRTVDRKLITAIHPDAKIG